MLAVLRVGPNGYVGTRGFQWASELGLELRLAVSGGAGLAVEPEAVARGRRPREGFCEFTARLPEASTLASLRVAAAARAALRWSMESGGCVGVRIWTHRYGRLLSVYIGAGISGDSWSAPTATAVCVGNFMHRAPHPDCACGIYAARPDSPQAVPAVDDYWVAGVVALYGRVIPHAGGWRAERARILELWAPPGSVDPSRYPGVTIHEL
jgi:hypothetical protein